MLPESELAGYLQPLTEEQRASILGVRLLVLTSCPMAVEVIDKGKWFGGMLTYSDPKGGFIYALGPRKDGATSFHMMPYYASKELQERHSIALKKFLTGKSCIKFRSLVDLPTGVLEDIIGSTAKYLVIAEQMMAERSRKR